MRRLLLSILFLAAAAGTARAQRGVDDQVFKPAVDSYGIFGTERARTSKQYDFGFQFYFDFAQNPLHLKMFNGTNSPDTHVVDSTATFHLGMHMGITDRLELAFDMPMTKQSLNASGFGVPINPTTGAPTGFFAVDAGSNVQPPEVTPGDMRWALKVNAWQGGPLSLGGAVIATLPFGDETEFLGASSFTVEPLAIADLSFGRLGIALNAGYRWHNSKDVVLDPAVVAKNRAIAMGTINAEMSTPPVLIAESDEIVLSAAGVLHINPYVSGALQVLHVEPINPNDSAKGMPGANGGDAVTDIYLGALFHPFPDFTVSMGFTPWVVYRTTSPFDGARSEDFGVFAGLAWAPEGEGGGALMGGDRDHDGVPDSQDLCPDEPEDRDGFEDADGCPDPDNDQDGIPDAQDRCPNEPEDRDGFQDADGCPDPDNDGDGIPDIQDKCPNEPEDRDGFQDEDGCPDPDNDGDGIPDAQDKCPNEPETFNGFEDADGCPDTGIGTKGTVQFTEKLLFKERSAKIEPAVAKILDEYAAKLKRNPQIKKIFIEGHTDNAGNAQFQTHISQQRADAVREYLIRKGVPTTLQSVGYGAKRPIDTNSTKEGRAKNRRVELTVVE
jgi:outer membrane protein OmpA-like peptidoglycan-associated protein